MKKIFTLLCAAALSCAAASAETLPISLYKYTYGNLAGFIAADSEYLGVTEQTYTEENGVYTFADFLYKGATLTFTIDESISINQVDGAVGAGEPVYGVSVIYGGEDAIIRSGNSAGTKFNFHLTDEENADMRSEEFKSVEFVGDGESYMLIRPEFWCVVPGSTATAILKHTYAVKTATGYDVYWQGSSSSYWGKIGAEWGFEQKELKCFLTFSLPAATSGIEAVAAAEENAPVEYFNLQGVRVENPTQGLYIRRQGSEVKKVVL